MKKLFIIALVMGAVYSCEKTELKPQSTNVGLVEETDKTQSPPVKMEANKKKWNNCTVWNHGVKLGAGEKCSGEGNECGRKAYCKLGYNSLIDDEIVFDGLTYKEFVDMWNSDEGRKVLEAKGVYETED